MGNSNSLQREDLERVNLDLADFSQLSDADIIFFGYVHFRRVPLKSLNRAINEYKQAANCEKETETLSSKYYTLLPYFMKRKKVRK